MRTIYLRFADAAEALDRLGAAGLTTDDDGVAPVTLTAAGPVYADVLFGTGIVFEPTGATDGDGQPLTTAVPGYHVNLLVPEAWEPPAALASKAVTPASPACVFAGG
jgi:hypothetical protein